jgi:beta-glucanase (GH16 family)
MKHDGMELVWAQDFSAGSGPDPEWWSFELGHGRNGWGNRELQSYENGPDVCAVRDGRLVITGNHEPRAAEPFTSARIHTCGKASWTYGRFEFRVKVPHGAGTWPAIWMLSDTVQSGTPWPRCGEIDIVEYVGRDPGRVFFSLHSEEYNHTRGNHVSESHLVPGVTDGFHTYVMDWDEQGFRFSLDDTLLSTFSRGDKTGEAEWPFDQPFHLIVNLALGGTLGGEIDASALPATLEIESMRVYQRT